MSRLIQAVPVWLAGADTHRLEAIPDEPGGRPEWDVAHVFANDNVARYGTLMALARVPGIVWSLLGMWLVGKWAAELYGRRAALLASLLWCLGPNVLAHASLATPDLPCAVASLAASYSFHRYLRCPTTPAAYLSGALLGVAQLTKFTALTDYVAWAVLAAAACVAPSMAAYRSLPPARRLGHVVLTGVVSILIINLGYGCEGTLIRLGEFDFVSRPLSIPGDTGTRRNVFAGTWAEGVPVPLPANYVRGLDLQQADFEGTRRSYLRGEWRDHGWWYFYLYAALVKIPLGTLALAAIGFVLSFTPRFRRFDELIVWLPVAVLWAVASAKTGYTMHFRYVLPALPFALVGLSKAAEVRPRWGRVLVWVLASCSVVSSLCVFPHSLAYFNEAAGGPSNGAAHLVDSNLDWGQDLYRFKDWYDSHPDARPVFLAYNNFVDYRAAGLPQLKATPGDPVHLTPGYYVLDVHSLHADNRAYFLQVAPVGRVGFTMRIYHLSAADIELILADQH
ncbi:hypothetical protein FRUB_09195 [Fimbriiglobus ruber]|uniref:Glycosyltransferase RgtA/B/C/D-like domain-containing protein n=1 Tax=Fimbriiglobus ruber TaxID=1908690 RepID=A0A225D570_9BACT|nr:hypothetical protein FRUB_09195 [Fimbriiglobus ruber]